MWADDTPPRVQELLLRVRTGVGKTSLPAPFRVYVLTVHRAHRQWFDGVPCVVIGGCHRLAEIEAEEAKKTGPKVVISDEDAAALPSSSCGNVSELSGG